MHCVCECTLISADVGQQNRIQVALSVNPEREIIRKTLKDVGHRNTEAMLTTWQVTWKFSDPYSIFVSPYTTQIYTDYSHNTSPGISSQQYCICLPYTSKVALSVYVHRLIYTSAYIYMSYAILSGRNSPLFPRSFQEFSPHKDVKSGLHICKENVKTQKPSPRFFSPVPRNRYWSPKHRVLRFKWVLLWPLPLFLFLAESSFIRRSVYTSVHCIVCGPYPGDVKVVTWSGQEMLVTGVATLFFFLLESQPQWYPQLF